MKTSDNPFSRCLTLFLIPLFAACSGQLSAANISIDMPITLVSLNTTVADSSHSYQDSASYDQDWLLSVSGGTGSGYFDLLFALSGTSNEGSQWVNLIGSSGVSVSIGSTFRNGAYVPDGYGYPMAYPTITIPFTFDVPEVIHIAASASTNYRPSNVHPEIDQTYQGGAIRASVILETGPVGFRSIDYPATPLFVYGAFTNVHGTFTPLSAEADEPVGTSAVVPEPASIALFTIGLSGLGILRRKVS